MGIAIIWIFLFHSLIFEIFDFSIFDPIIYLGRAGVSLFLFVSGFGLYHSLSNNTDVLGFYKRRFKRIVPTFVVWYIVSRVLTGNYMSLITYNGIISYVFYECWYIPFILVLYFLYPIIIYRLQKYRMYLPTILSVIMSIVLGVLIVHFHKEDPGNLYWLWSQHPAAFCLGSLLADNRFEKNLNLRIFGIICVIMVVYYSLTHNDLINEIVYLSLLVPIILLVDKLDKVSCKPVRLCMGGVNRLGTISMELYIVHMFFFPRILDHFTPISKWLGFIIFLLLSLCSAIALKLMINQLNRFYEICCNRLN